MISTESEQKAEKFRHPSGNAKRPRRKGRSGANEGIRYFVGRPAEPDGKPTLEQEVASEPEALVTAFKGDKRVYFISEYRVTQKIEGGLVRLEKEPAPASQRVSTTNES
jgi:hypothetical protein